MRRLLLLIAAALGLLVAYQWYAPGAGVAPLPPVAARKGQPQRPLDRPPASLQTLPAVAFYQPVIDRPLFSPTRTPAQPPQEESVSGEVKTDHVLELKGIVLTPAGRVALVEGPGGRVERLREQDTWYGWRVDHIGPQAVVLDQGAEKRELPLRAYAKVPPSKPPPKQRPQTAYPRPVPSHGQQADSPTTQAGKE